MEYLWTCTPSIILFFLQKYKLKSCTYLDADIYFFSNPEIIYQNQKNYSVFITSHNYHPKYDQTETSGKYCVQYLTFKNNKMGLGVLKWWRRKCIKWCYNRVEGNKFGDQKYFTAMKDESNKIFYNTYCKEATIIYTKQNVPHYKHISAQVTAYQRLNIFEQLLRMDEQKIIRVCVDGIYYFNHECEIHNIYQDKTHEKTFNNSPCVDYLSGLFKKNQNSIKGIKFGKKRDFI